MKRLWLLFIAGSITALAVLGYGIIIIRDDTRTLMLDEARAEHRIVTQSIREFKQTQEQLISTLTIHPVLLRFLEQNDADTRAKLQELFRYTVRARGNIMQLRYIDSTGRERIRVDRRRDGTLADIAEPDLQNKAHRYYVKQFLALDENVTGYSEFDLNIEHNAIEVPFNPTLRIGRTVVRDGRRDGVIVINYYMETWLEQLGDIAGTELMLVDAQDAFLLHPDSAWAWSGHLDPPRTASEYFGNAVLPRLWHTRAPYAWVDSATIALPVMLFDTPLLALYRFDTPQNALVTHKVLEFSTLTMIALLLVLLPALAIIRLSYRRLESAEAQTRQQSEYLETIFNNTFDALVVIDGEATIKSVNHAAVKLFGHTATTMIGSNVSMLIPDPHREKHDGYVASAHHIEGSTIIGADRELEALHADGTLIPVSIAVTRTVLDETVQFIATIRDLRQLRALQIETREKESMLIHQSKLASMGEMLGAIAHQWRQPLNAMGLIVQDLVSAYEYGELDGTYFKNSKQELMEQLNFMSQTIDEFRNFFKSTEQRQSCDLITLLDEVRRLYWPQLKAHGIDLEVTCSDGEGGTVSCDSLDEHKRRRFILRSRPADIKQLLLTLISNAKDAIDALVLPEQAQRTIFVRLLLSDDALHVEIIDRAGGISPDLQTRIFEPYFTTKEMGTGLGLFIAASLAERRLGAVLEYFPRVPEKNGGYAGSCFRLTLPRAPHDPAPAE